MKEARNVKERDDRDHDPKIEVEEIIEVPASVLTLAMTSNLENGGDEENNQGMISIISFLEIYIQC